MFVRKEKKRAGKTPEEEEGGEGHKNIIPCTAEGPKSTFHCLFFLFCGKRGGVHNRAYTYIEGGSGKKSFLPCSAFPFSFSF